jgi:hypothetical protein
MSNKLENLIDNTVEIMGPLLGNEQQKSVNKISKKKANFINKDHVFNILKNETSIVRSEYLYTTKYIPKALYRVAKKDFLGKHITLNHFGEKMPLASFEAARVRCNRNNCDILKISLYQVKPSQPQKTLALIHQKDDFYYYFGFNVNEEDTSHLILLPKEYLKNPERNGIKIIEIIRPETKFLISIDNREVEINSYREMHKICKAFNENFKNFPTIAQFRKKVFFKTEDNYTFLSLEDFTKIQSTRTHSNQTTEVLTNFNHNPALGSKQSSVINHGIFARPPTQVNMQQAITTHNPVVNTIVPTNNL